MYLPDYYKGKLLLIDKPLDWTSHDVVNKLKLTLNRYRIKKGSQTEPRTKVGHAGTLDPKATGLLLVATGKMTKTLQHLQGQDKCYEGELKLGATTPSLDRETEEMAHQSIAGLTEAQIHQVAKKFQGSIEQVPPVYSAHSNQRGARLCQSPKRGRSPAQSAHSTHPSTGSSGH